MRVGPPILDDIVRPARGRGGGGVADCGFLKKVDSVNVTLLLILLYVDFLAFSPVRG